MADDKPTADEVAADFGYTVAFFKADPELWKLLQNATGGSWSTSRFVAALQNTNWFRTKSEPYRKFVALKQSDPATFAQQVHSTAAHILTAGGQMGAIMTSKEATQMAEQAMMLGWTDEQLKAVLSTKLDRAKNGLFFGQAASFQKDFRQAASDYGVSVSDSWMQRKIQGAVLGKNSPESVRAELAQTASSKYVALKDRILGGETVRSIADPYIQSYGKLLELNSDNISLDDPLIQKALQARDAKGVPTTQTVYDFEQTLRNDSRWAKTKNAQDQMSATANSILQTFGLA